MIGLISWLIQLNLERYRPADWLVSLMQAFDWLQIYEEILGQSEAFL